MGSLLGGDRTGGAFQEWSSRESRRPASSAGGRARATRRAPKRLGAQAVEATLGVAADLDQAGVAQHLEVPGNAGLVHADSVESSVTERSPSRTASRIRRRVGSAITSRTASSSGTASTYAEPHIHANVCYMPPRWSERGASTIRGLPRRHRVTDVDVRYRGVHRIRRAATTAPATPHAATIARSRQRTGSAA